MLRLHSVTSFNDIEQLHDISLQLFAVVLITVFMYIYIYIKPYMFIIVTECSLRHCMIWCADMYTHTCICIYMCAYNYKCYCM